jgi:hypothetical protein
MNKKAQGTDKALMKRPRRGLGARGSENRKANPIIGYKPLKLFIDKLLNIRSEVTPKRLAYAPVSLFL